MTATSYDRTSFSGYVIPTKQYAIWENVIEEWGLMIDRYCRIFDADAPYWYTERANVGLISGACWRVGLIALEEFQHSKGYRNQSKNVGRADLWIGSSQREIFVEAKQKEISLDSTDLQDVISSSLAEAKDDARKTKKHLSDVSAVAMVFIPVYASKEYKVEEINERIDLFIEKVRNEFKGKLIFWHFPPGARQLVGQNKELCWPGLIVLGEEVT
jgi:hypothetical protein